MEARYKKATIEDLDLLVDMRIKVLRAANMLSEETDMSEVRRCSYRYYKEALCNGSHTAYLVFDGNNVIGTGGDSFFQVMPTYHNPSGRKVYIMNMYTDPVYRRRGVAYKTLDLLVRDIRKCGVPLFPLKRQRWGNHYMKNMDLSKMQNEMELP